MRGDIGRVVKKGKIRVDARKAMAKLREHLLVDLHLYAVEVVRAAVLAGASRIDVGFDADDVTITFDGQVLEVDALPRLFEHLTGESDGEVARRERLLALAVNAALGLAPAWVSVMSASGGTAARVVWSPALVAAIEREEKPLPEPEMVPLPRGMPQTGTRFHLHRKVGWETVRRATARNLPREVALLVEAAHCLAVPLFVNGQPAPVPSRAPALARAAISLPGVRSAHVEIVGGWLTAPHIEFCELGILLTRASFAFGAHFPMAEHLGVTPPVRIVIDATALPTNASRSAVREDAPLFGTIKNAAAPALADAIAGIAATVFGKGNVPEGVTVDASNPVALHDALGAFLCAAEASLLARVKLPDALRDLLDLPLFQDGIGRPLTHATIPRADPLLVWSGPSPVPVEMAPWADQIVWQKGRLAERVLTARKCLDQEHLAAAARLGASRYKKLVAMPRGEVRVPDDSYLAREAFRFDDGPFAGLSGEVAIAAEPAAYVRNLGLRVFLEGRSFEAFPIPEASVPLPCLIALQWPGHIVPKFAYDGVEPTSGMRAALAFAVRQAVLLCERFAASRPRTGQPFDPPRAMVLRAALATAVLAPRRIYSAEGFEMPALSELPGLVYTPVWPTTAGPFVSLQTICEEVAKTGAICVAAPGSKGRAPDGRPVVTLLSGELEWLTACLRPGVTVVRYDAALVAKAERRRAPADFASFIESVASEALAPVFHAESGSVDYAVTLGASAVRVWHAGVELSRIELDESFGGVTIAIDDDSIVPSADWKSVAHAGDSAIAGRAERAFAERIVGALAGGVTSEQARADLFHAPSGPRAVRYAWPEDLANLSRSVARYLVDLAARGRRVDASDADRDLGARVEAIPFLQMIAEGGELAPVSLAAVERTHPAPEKIPVLTSPPRFRALDWHPLVVADRPLAEALARWSGGRASDASDDLLTQERRAAGRDQLSLFLTRDTLDPKAIGPRGDAATPVVHLPAVARHGLFGVTVALPLPEVEIERTLVEVLFHDRLVGEQLLPNLAVPVVARVTVLDIVSLEGFDRLSPFGEGGVSARVVHAATALALKLIERASQPGASHTLFGDRRALMLLLGLLARADRDHRLDVALRQGPLPWPTVQGDAQPWNQLRFVDGQLWVGTVLHASWISAPQPTDLDRPILFVPPTPEGSALVGILEQLGLKLRAVSDALATLQAARSRGASESTPRLAQRPADPALVRDLSQLSVSGMEGEVAIFESGDPVAQLLALDGETRLVKLDLTFPAKAVVRMPVLTSSGAPIAAEQIARAAVRLLVSLIPSLDRLPPFLRAHLRALACRAVSKGRNVPAVVRAAPLFPDVDGHLWSLDELLAPGATDWSCTFDPPPYPRARQDGRTLVLTPAEHRELLARVAILNVTEWMRRDLEADRRREAPPVDSIRFEPSARAHLVSSFVVKEASIEGEIGLLRPESEQARGLQVFTTRRPLCTLTDAPGWPVAAVLNDDTLHPTRWFDGVLPADEAALRARVRALATAHLRQLSERGLPPARDLLQSDFVDEALPPVAAYGSTHPITVTGTVYLPRTWPTAPAVRLFVQTLAPLDAQSITLASAPIAGDLPLCGTLFVAHAAPLFSRGDAHRLALALRDGLARTLRPLIEASPDDPELLAYAWNLRLLGATFMRPPTARAADGATVTAEDVLAALAGPGEIWLTDQRGIVEGAFPSGAPRFILPDDEKLPLVRVLRARLPPSKLKVLGGLASASFQGDSAPSRAAATASDRAPDSIPPASARALAPRSSPPPAGASDATFDAADTRNRGGGSWLGAVLDRALGLFSPAPPPEPTGFGAAVERALRALRLRDEPVTAVHEVTRGKLVRYDKARRAILLNVAHPALARHVAAPSPTVVRRACIALVAAAISEVNIALENVTDHDEEQALLELLRQEAAAGR